MVPIPESSCGTYSALILSPMLAPNIRVVDCNIVEALGDVALFLIAKSIFNLLFSKPSVID